MLRPQTNTIVCAVALQRFERVVTPKPKNLSDDHYASAFSRALLFLYYLAMTAT